MGAAASAVPSVLKWEAVGGMRNAGVFESYAPFSLKSTLWDRKPVLVDLLGLVK